MVDPFATMLYDGLMSGTRATQTAEVFRTEASQERILKLLEQCRFVVVSTRGEAQLSNQSKEWLRAHFVRRYPPQGQPGPDVWERLPQGSN